MEKKRGLIISYNDLNNSGVPNVIFQVIKSLSDEYDFDIITFGDDAYYLNKLNDIDIFPHVFKFQTQTKNGRSSGVKYHLCSYPRLMYKQTLEILSKQKYDVIHSFKENYSWPFLKAAKKCGISKRIVHSNIDSSRDGSFTFKLLDKHNKRNTLHYATHLVGVSRRCCERSFGNRKSFVLHNGYNEDNYNANIKYTDEVDCLTLLQVGAFNSNKNQLFSLEIAKILKQNRVLFRMVFVGRETENGYLNLMNKYINNNCLATNVQIINGCNDVRPFYEKSKFVLMPSKSEGASIVAVEAQACGLKVFASSSIPSDMNVGGIIFIDKNHSPLDWAKKIIKENDKKYSRNQYDMAEFSQKTFKKKLRELYDS